MSEKRQINWLVGKISNEYKALHYFLLNTIFDIY